MDGNFYDPKTELQHTLHAGPNLHSRTSYCGQQPIRNVLHTEKGSRQTYERNSLLMGHLLMSTYLGNVSIWQNVVPVEQLNSNIPLYCLYGFMYCFVCVYLFLFVLSVLV